jgi:hemolysin activation/secretion protein
MSNLGVTLAWAAAIVVALGAATPTFAQPAPGVVADVTADVKADVEAGARFDIMEFEVAGNSVLREAEIEKAVTPYLGPGRLIGDAEGARAALEKTYQDAGYLTVFVDLPEQRIDEGVVRLQVLEGRVERLAVTGSRYFSQGYIRDKVPELAEGRVPNFNVVQAELATVNRTPERRVQPVLRPGIAPGTVEAELKVDDKLPLSASIELNNQHAPDTDPYRIAATLRYDNLWQRDHSIALNAIVSPRDTKQSRVLSLNYTIPRDNGDTWVAYAVSSDSNVATLGGTSVVGNGNTLGLRYVAPFFAGPGSYQSFSIGADYKDLKEQVVFGSDAISTPLRYLPFNFGYTGNWSGERSQTTATATLSTAVASILRREVACPGNVGPVDQFACKRQGADGGFATLRVDLRETDSWRWGTTALRVAGQWANEPLASAEQFSMGGAETVRGYLESVASGDMGVLSSLEMRSPNWSTLANRWLGDAKSGWFTDLTLSAFVDAARVRTIDAAAGQPDHETLAGTGIGLRASGRHGWYLAFDLATPHTQPANVTTKSTRVHVRLGWKL